LALDVEIYRPTSMKLRGTEREAVGSMIKIKVEKEEKKKEVTNRVSEL
jgi:hypothetical protein